MTYHNPRWSDRTDFGHAPRLPHDSHSYRRTVDQAGNCALAPNSGSVWCNAFLKTGVSAVNRFCRCMKKWSNRESGRSLPNQFCCRWKMSSGTASGAMHWKARTVWISAQSCPARRFLSCVCPLTGLPSKAAFLANIFFAAVCHHARSSTSHKCSIIIDGMSQLVHGEAIVEATKGRVVNQIGVMASESTLAGMSDDLRKRLLRQMGHLCVFACTDKDAEILVPFVFGKHARSGMRGCDDRQPRTSGRYDRTLAVRETYRTGSPAILLLQDRRHCLCISSSGTGVQPPVGKRTALRYNGSMVGWLHSYGF